MRDRTVLDQSDIWYKYLTKDDVARYIWEPRPNPVEEDN